jgi:uncharacterized membrane protein YeaQ/YmgE (transglycosylase-associated protein family)
MFDRASSDPTCAAAAKRRGSGWRHDPIEIRAQDGDPEQNRHTTRKGDLMGVIGWLLLGLIAGAIAKTIHRGPEPGGVLGTLSVGVGGALLGGLVASAIGVGGISSFFSVGTWPIAIAGAVLLLFLYEALTSQDSRTREPASSIATTSAATSTFIRATRSLVSTWGRWCSLCSVCWWRSYSWFSGRSW